MKCPRFCKKGASRENQLFLCPLAGTLPACLVLDILDVIKCRKMGEEIGNRLMLECILHTMPMILSVVLLLTY